MTKAYKVSCDCQAVELTMTGQPRVHAFCHCEDCRELLQVPYHSVLAWEAEQLSVSRGEDMIISFQHPHKRMQRIFCRQCGEVLYNTNAMGWKLVSQLLFQKCNGTELPQGLESNAHFFYDRRIVDIEDSIPKR